MRDVPPFASGVSNFRINGSVHHRIGALLPPPGKSPVCAQLFVLDSNAVVHAVRGLRFGDSLREDLIEGLAAMFKRENLYAKTFEYAAKLDVPNAVVKIFARPGPQSRSYNLPSAPQVAVMVPDSESMAIAGNTRDIIVRKRGGGLQHISEFNVAFDPLHFVMMFPRGERGWGIGIPRNVLYAAHTGLAVHDDLGDLDRSDRPDTGVDMDLADRGEDRMDDLGEEGVEDGPGFQPKTVTARDYMAYHMFTRLCPCGAVRPTNCTCTGNFWHRCGALFEEWMCTNWAKVEQHRLTWHRMHQDVLRGDLYQGLQDAVRDGATTSLLDAF